MKIIIEIDAKFGSDFQKDFGLSCLRASIDAWHQYLNANHKKNIIVTKTSIIGDRQKNAIDNKV